MKYCPNPNCLFLKEFDKIAEFQNDVMACSDCGTMLEIGNAPTPEALDACTPHKRRTSLLLWSRLSPSTTRLKQICFEPGWKRRESRQ